MSRAMGSYSFLPWLRQGLGNQITAADGSVTATRASIPVTLKVVATGLDGTDVVSPPIARDIELYGPGDVVGIDARAIVRTEPRDWITDFEPNYFPFVEFYDEDFPWRYTPAAPAGDRLRPWLTLLVLEEGEFREGANAAEKPLPDIEIPDASVFPPEADLWAWAHVHVNRALATTTESTNTTAVLSALDAALAENPDLACSRLLSPRRLRANAAYHAFLVPSFEPGRLAGLGLDPAAAPSATASAWGAYGGRLEATRYPYYHRFYFRTGSSGDFEYLVRLLQPKKVDPRVGTRDLDVTRPGLELPPATTDPALRGVLRLGGVLRVPEASLDPSELAEAERYENWDASYPVPFQTRLAQVLDLGSTYTTTSVAAANQAAGLATVADPDPDPWVVPPIYGRWHAATPRVLDDDTGAPLPNRDNWVHELNLDPRHRATARYGTEVIQAGQEELMAAAWRQVGDVLEANRRIRLGALAQAAGSALHDRTFLPFAVNRPGKLLALAGPVTQRLRADRKTIAYRMRESIVPPVMTSVSMRRALRPNTRLLRHLGLDPKTSAIADVLVGLDDGRLVAAPAKEAPAGAPTLGPLVDALPDTTRPTVRPWHWAIVAFLVVLAVVFAFLLLFPAALACLVAAAVVAIVLFVRTRRGGAPSLGTVLGEEGQIATPVDELPKSPDFTLSRPEDGLTPATGGGADSPTATRFKEAIRDASVLLGVSQQLGKTPERVRLDLREIEASIERGLQPRLTVPAYLRSVVWVPPRLRPGTADGERFDEIMAHPVIDTPMYKPLVAKSPDLFLPNINLLEPNSMTLLETNQAFIEAYMVGLNHEFAAELLWREYPTDQRGTVFRQFWDASTVLATNPEDPALRESLRDIPEIHRWPRASKLGDHDHREAGGTAEEELVLTIRGDLLKKYPTAVIYAHRARWQMKDGKIDRSAPRLPVEITAAEEAAPPRSKLRTPLYEAKVDPDIYFLGFDLTAAEARGGTSGAETDDPGWFFVIKERPGDPRFGLDEGSAAGGPKVWNDLGWEDVVPGVVNAGDPAKFLRPTASAFTLTAPATSDPRAEQYADDRDVRWDANVDAARLAYIFFQAPVLVAVHAAKMLEDPNA